MLFINNNEALWSLVTTGAWTGHFTFIGFISSSSHIYSFIIVTYYLLHVIYIINCILRSGCFSLGWVWGGGGELITTVVMYCPKLP